MKQTLITAEGTLVDPRGLSVLAYIRVRPSNFDSLADIFITYPQPELSARLAALCTQQYLRRGVSGRYWLTALGMELLDSQHIIAALEAEAPPTPIRIVQLNQAPPRKRPSK